MLRDRVTVRCLHRHCGPMVLTFVPFAPERAHVRATCAVGRRLMATTIRANVKTPTDLRDWLKKIDDIGELQVVTGANTEEDIGMATELLGRTRPSKATLFDEIVGFKKGFRVLSNGLGSFRRIPVTLGFYISPGKHGRQHRDKWFARGEKMPVAFVPGGDPLLFLAACTEIPYGVTEYDWAGGVRGTPYRVMPGPVTGLPIPVDAEIVIEGYADGTDKMVEGPFGEWTGYYA